MAIVVFFLLWWLVAWGLMKRYNQPSDHFLSESRDRDRPFAIIMSNLIGILYGIMGAGITYLVI